MSTIVEETQDGKIVKITVTHKDGRQEHFWPPVETLSERMLLCLTPTQKSRYKASAEAEGWDSCSSWCRDVLDQASNSCLPK